MVYQLFVIFYQTKPKIRFYLYLECRRF